MRKGSRYHVKAGTSAWSRGWWAFSCYSLRRVLGAATSMTVVMLGSMAVELLGLSIGGSVSSAAVATRFAVEEARMLRDRDASSLWVTTQSDEALPVRRLLGLAQIRGRHCYLQLLLLRQLLAFLCGLHDRGTRQPGLP